MIFFDESVPAQIVSYAPSQLWLFLPLGYLLTISIETPFLLVGLSPKITLKQKLFCGVWLTACTYPVVVLVLPMLFDGFSRFSYLLVAETFAPVAECLLFWLVFGKNLRGDSLGLVRSLIAVVLANLASFGIGELISSQFLQNLFS